MADERYGLARPCFSKIEPLTPENSMRVHPIDRSPDLSSAFTGARVLEQVWEIHRRCFNRRDHAPIDDD